MAIRLEKQRRLLNLDRVDLVADVIGHSWRGRRAQPLAARCPEVKHAWLPLRHRRQPTLERGLELLLSARRISADEALQIGLVSRVASADQPLADCLREFTADWRGRSPGVMRGYKALSLARRRELHARLAPTEERHFSDTWIDADHWDALAAAARARARTRQ